MFLYENVRNSSKVMRRGPYRAALCLLTAVVFLANTFLVEAAWAFPATPGAGGGASAGTLKTLDLNVETFELPARMGTITDRHDAGEGARVVVHIQDAHCNYHAQRKIKEVIGHFSEKFGIGIVNLEGGSGGYDLSIFDEIEDATVRYRVADHFLKDGLLNGAEFFAVNNPGEVRLWGVEDIELYLKNLNAYRGALPYKSGAYDYLNEIASMLERLKKRIFSPELLALDEIHAGYRAGNIGFEEYLFGIIEEARKSDLVLTEYPNTGSLSSVLEKEAEMDFQLANVQRDDLIERLIRILSMDEADELVERMARFQAGDISDQEFYSYLDRKARVLMIGLDDYPELERYVEYLLLYGSVEKSALIREIREIETELKEDVYRNDKERELDLLSRHLALMKDMAEISITKDEYSYYKANRELFGPDRYEDFIRDNLPGPVIPDKGELEMFRSKIESFYGYAFVRDERFLENIRFTPARGGSEDPEALRDTDSPVQAAMLVTGGFHTENLAELFRDNGISYISVMPGFTNEPGYENPYFRLLSGEHDNVVRALSESMMALALFTYFGEKSHQVYGAQVPGAKASVLALLEAVYSNPDSVASVVVDNREYYVLDPDQIPGEIADSLKKVRGLKIGDMRVYMASADASQEKEQVDTYQDRPALGSLFGRSRIAVFGLAPFFEEAIRTLAYYYLGIIGFAAFTGVFLFAHYRRYRNEYAYHTAHYEKLHGEHAPPAGSPFGVAARTLLFPAITVGISTALLFTFPVWSAPGMFFLANWGLHTVVNLVNRALFAEGFAPASLFSTSGKLFSGVPEELARARHILYMNDLLEQLSKKAEKASRVDQGEDRDALMKSLTSKIELLFDSVEADTEKMLSWGDRDIALFMDNLEGFLKSIMPYYLGSIMAELKLMDCISAYHSVIREHVERSLKTNPDFAGIEKEGAVTYTQEMRVLMADRTGMILEGLNLTGGRKKDAEEYFKALLYSTEIEYARQILQIHVQLDENVKGLFRTGLIENVVSSDLRFDNELGTVCWGTEDTVNFAKELLLPPSVCAQSTKGVSKRVSHELGLKIGFSFVVLDEDADDARLDADEDVKTHEEVHRLFPIGGPYVSAFKNVEQESWETFLLDETLAYTIEKIQPGLLNEEILPGELAKIFERHKEDRASDIAATVTEIFSELSEQASESLESDPARVYALAKMVSEAIFDMAIYRLGMLEDERSHLHRDEYRKKRGSISRDIVDVVAEVCISHRGIDHFERAEDAAKLMRSLLNARSVREEKIADWKNKIIGKSAGPSAYSLSRRKRDGFAPIEGLTLFTLVGLLSVVVLSTVLGISTLGPAEFLATYLYYAGDALSAFEGIFSGFSGSGEFIVAGGLPVIGVRFLFRAVFDRLVSVIRAVPLPRKFRRTGIPDLEKLGLTIKTIEDEREHIKVEMMFRDKKIKLSYEEQSDADGVPTIRLDFSDSSMDHHSIYGIKRRFQKTSGELAKKLKEIVEVFQKETGDFYLEVSGEHREMVLDDKNNVTDLKISQRRMKAYQKHLARMGFKLVSERKPNLLYVKGFIEDIRENQDSLGKIVKVQQSLPGGMTEMGVKIKEAYNAVTYLMKSLERLYNDLEKAEEVSYDDVIEKTNEVISKMKEAGYSKEHALLNRLFEHISCIFPQSYIFRSPSKPARVMDPENTGITYRGITLTALLAALAATGLIATVTASGIAILGPAEFLATYLYYAGDALSALGGIFSGFGGSGEFMAAGGLPLAGMTVARKERSEKKRKAAIEKFIKGLFPATKDRSKRKFDGTPAELEKLVSEVFPAARFYSTDDAEEFINAHFGNERSARAALKRMGQIYDKYMGYVLEVNQRLSDRVELEGSHDLDMTDVAFIGIGFMYRDQKASLSTQAQDLKDDMELGLDLKGLWDEKVDRIFGISAVFHEAGHAFDSSMPSKSFPFPGAAVDQALEEMRANWIVHKLCSEEEITELIVSLIAHKKKFGEEMSHPLAAQLAVIAEKIGKRDEFFEISDKNKQEGISPGTSKLYVHEVVFNAYSEYFGSLELTGMRILERPFPQGIREVKSKFTPDTGDPARSSPGSLLGKGVFAALFASPVIEEVIRSAIYYGWGNYGLGIAGLSLFALLVFLPAHYMRYRKEFDSYRDEYEKEKGRAPPRWKVILNAAVRSVSVPAAVSVFSSGLLFVTPELSAGLIAVTGANIILHALANYVTLRHIGRFAPASIKFSKMEDERPPEVRLYGIKEVIISEEIKEELIAKSKGGTEQIGVLWGKVEGDRIRITHVVSCAKDLITSGVGSVMISPDGHRDLLEQLLRAREQEPDLARVGWWHSYPEELILGASRWRGQYSGLDIHVMNQIFDNQIGILVNPIERVIGGGEIYFFDGRKISKLRPGDLHPDYSYRGVQVGPGRIDLSRDPIEFIPAHKEESGGPRRPIEFTPVREGELAEGEGPRRPIEFTPVHEGELAEGEGPRRPIEFTPVREGEPGHVRYRSPGGSSDTYIPYDELITLMRNNSYFITGRDNFGDEISFPVLIPREVLRIGNEDLLGLFSMYSHVIKQVEPDPVVFYVGLGIGERGRSQFDVKWPLLYTDFRKLIGAENQYVGFEQFKELLDANIGAFVKGDIHYQCVVDDSFNRSGVYKATFTVFGKERTVTGYYGKKYEVSEKTLSANSSLHTALEGGVNVLIDRTGGFANNLEVKKRLLDCLRESAGFVIDSRFPITRPQSIAQYHPASMAHQQSGSGYGEYSSHPASLYELLTREMYHANIAAVENGQSLYFFNFYMTPETADKVLERVSPPVGRPEAGPRHFKALKLAGARDDFIGDDETEARKAEGAVIPGGAQDLRMTESDLEILAEALFREEHAYSDRANEMGALVNRAVRALGGLEERLTDKDILVSLLEKPASRYLFEDDMEKGIIGINITLLDIAKKNHRVARLLFVLGLAHELRHQAGAEEERPELDAGLACDLMGEMGVDLTELEDALAGHLKEGNTQFIKAVRGERARRASGTSTDFGAAAGRPAFEGRPEEALRAQGREEPKLGDMYDAAIELIPLLLRAMRRNAPTCLVAPAMSVEDESAVFSFLGEAGRSANGNGHNISVSSYRRGDRERLEDAVDTQLAEFIRFIKENKGAAYTRQARMAVRIIREKNDEAYVSGLRDRIEERLKNDLAGLEEAEIHAYIKRVHFISVEVEDGAYLNTVIDFFTDVGMMECDRYVKGDYGDEELPDRMVDRFLALLKRSITNHGALIKKGDNVGDILRRIFAGTPLEIRAVNWDSFTEWRRRNEQILMSV